MTSRAETAPQSELLARAEKFKQKYPHRIPVILTRDPKSGLPELPKNKYLVPEAMSFSGFKFCIHKQLTSVKKNNVVKDDQTIYLMVGDTKTTPKNTNTMQQVYEEYGSDDGFLYLTYTAENTFG